MKISNNQVLQRITKIPPAYFVFLALLIVLWVSRPHLLNINIMGIFIRQVAPLGILVLGQLLVMRVRSIDLSGAGLILLINYYISSGLFHGASPLFFILISLATGLAFGFINGLLIALRRASAVIVTLAMNIILVGIVEYVASGKPPGDVPKYFNDLYNSKIYMVPVPIIFWVSLTAIMSVFLSRFVYGRYVASVGESPVASHFAGVPVERTVIVAHTISGLMAGFAGLVQTSSIAVGSIRFGHDLPMNAVAATILGGVIFGRGDGGVWGPFFGVLSFALLFIVMNTFGVQEPGKLVAQGLIILLAAIFSGIRTAKN